MPLFFSIILYLKFLINFIEGIFILSILFNFNILTCNLLPLIFEKFQRILQIKKIRSKYYTIITYFFIFPMMAASQALPL